MNSIEKGVNDLKEKIKLGQELEHKDFIMALTATLIEEVGADLKTGKSNEDKHE